MARAKKTNGTSTDSAASGSFECKLDALCMAMPGA
jgi:hypothetical protein